MSKLSKKTSKRRAKPGAIETMDDVVTNIFNQIVQYVIEDMVVVEPTEEENPEPGKPPDEVTKDYKDLRAEDLSNSQIRAASGSRVTLTKKTSRKAALSPLEVIREESEATVSTSSLPMEAEHQVKILFTSGNIYEGTISNRIMNGKGRYFWTDGTVYEGHFRDGFPTGHGRMTLPDLSFYEGEFNGGLFHGHGFLNIVATPMFYSGQWSNGSKHGHGWLWYEPGDWYEGGWAKGLKEGFGLRYYKNGAKYRGRWKEGKYDGEGTMIWENHDYYKGEWKEGLMHGRGEYIWNAFYNQSFALPVQNIYQGSWEAGKRRGQGVMCFGDGSGVKLKGWWDRDFKHGDGFLICGNGRTVEEGRLFQNDKPLLKLPIFAAPENVDVGFYVDTILAKLGEVPPEKLRILRGYEEKYIKNVITRYLPQLKELYHEYASLAAKTQLHYQPILSRLFLWQFYKDKEISKCGVSLIEIDDILGDNPGNCLDTLHDPFEPIYFWQFLISLVGVALKSTSLEQDSELPLQEGVSANIVKKFFDEVIFAKENDHQGTLILNYLDFAPIKAVYSLYQKVGEPHTARTFLRETCTRKGEVPLLCTMEMFSKERKPKFGTNLVPLDQHVSFEKSGGLELKKPMNHNWRNLFDFRHLGPKNVVKCLAKTCPLITSGDMVVNIDYPLTFLEFYETLLTCIFMVLELELKKERKRLQSVVPSATSVKQPESKKKVAIEKHKAKKKKKKL